MALNYDYTHLMTGKSQRLGSFWIHIKLDIAEIRKGAFTLTTGVPAQTDFKVAKLKGGTVIRDSYWRITEASTGSTTYNIGVTEAGTQIAAAIDSSTATDWAQGDYDPNDSIGSLAKATEDHYVWIMIDTAAAADGNLEILLECVAGADDNY
jgi:hypothetical protein